MLSVLILWRFTPARRAVAPLEKPDGQRRLYGLQAAPFRALEA